MPGKDKVNLEHLVTPHIKDTTEDYQGTIKGFRSLTEEVPIAKDRTILASIEIVIIMD